MRPKLTAAICLTMLSVAPLGCNGKNNKIVVSEADAAELAAVRAFELARANYQFRLEALVARYRRVGDMQKEIWAQRELKNLSDARTVKFEGFGRVVMPEARALEQADEALLVELVVAARKEYNRAACELLSHYDGLRDDRKVALMHGMFDRFDPVRTYLYYLSAEIPASTLVASDDIPGANEAFEIAMKLYESSGSVLKLGAEARAARRDALTAFRGLVQDFPKSNKIGRSAYFIAEIYRSLDEPTRAAVWYDRAFQWDSNLPDPARYRAATLYDFKIRDPAKARAYYMMAVKSEAGYRRNATHAKKRIKELSSASRSR